MALFGRLPKAGGSRHGIANLSARDKTVPEWPSRRGCSNRWTNRIPKGYWVVHMDVDIPDTYENYKAAKALRDPISTGDFMIVEGFDP